MSAGIAQAASDVIGAWLGYKGQKDANEKNIQLGREQMDFQERMSSTSHQRAVKDLQAAGLNPMLSVTQGGASSPGGAMPQVQSKLGAAVSSARQAGGTIAEMVSTQTQEAQLENIRAQTAKVKSETMDQTLNTAMLLAQAEKVRADTIPGALRYDTYEERLLRDRWGRLLTQEQREKAHTEANVAAESFSSDVARRKAESQLTQMEVPRAKSEAGFYEGLGKANPYLKALLMLLQGGASAARIGR